MSNDPTNWPKWATESISIEDYNYDWPRIAEDVIVELSELYQFDAKHFEHIGSTAVPGLSAKPIIDIMYPIENFLAIESMASALTGKGWQLVPPELDDKRHHRRTFVKVVNDRRFAHLHVILYESGDYELKRKFRDILRTHPLLMKEYSELKYHLAEKYKNDRESYTEAKSDFITCVLETNIE